MTFRHLETLPHAGLPEWQHHQFRADICRFHTLGGVLDFQQFAYTTAADGEAERREYHLQTANHTLHAVIAECNEQAAERAAEHRLPAPPPLTRFFSLQADMGRKISAERFYGNQLDLRHNRLVIRGQGSQSGRFLYHDSETDADRAIAPNALDTAFCHAFLNPPYPPRFGHSADIEAYEWNTDYSDYFDDGREWWGTYFWTVYSPQNGLYTGIMGSATD